MQGFLSVHLGALSGKGVSGVSEQGFLSVRRVKGRLLPLLDKNLACAQEAAGHILKRHFAPLAAGVAASPCAYAGAANEPCGS